MNVLRPVVSLGMVVACAVLLCGAAAQPQDEQPGGGEKDRAAVRARLERRLEEIRQLEASVTEAIDKLDKGASPEEVGRIARAPIRDGIRSRWMNERGPGDRGRDRPPGEMPKPEQVLQFFEQHNGPLAQRLRAFQAADPDAAQKLMGRLAPRVRELRFERDPELVRLRVDELRLLVEGLEATRTLGDAMSASDQAGTDAAKARIRQIVGEAFDIRRELHQREIKELEARLARLKADVDDQAARRDRFIQERLDDAVRAAERRAKGEPADGPSR